MPTDRAVRRRHERRIPLTEIHDRAGSVFRGRIPGPPHRPTRLVPGWWKRVRGLPDDPLPEVLSSDPGVILSEHHKTETFEPITALSPGPPISSSSGSAVPSSQPSSEDDLVIIDTTQSRPRAASPAPASPPRLPAARPPMPVPPGLPGVIAPTPGVPRKGARLGPWILEEELGRGGMGVIFKARHESWGDVVAIKVLRDPTRRSLIDRFTRETESMRRLEHPNIVRILDQGQAGNCPWFAMELISGKTLADLIREKQLLPRQAVSILRDVARATHHAHTLGVLHRDLKPANVLVANNGTVKVTDFGLAKLDDDERCLTRPGAPLGTPAFMSPEQALGGEVDRRTDVFSLGVMLFEAVSGRLPWTAENLAKVYGGGPVELPRLKRGDGRLEAIVGRATQARAEGRFDTAEAFAKELDAWLVGSVPSSSRLARRVVTRLRNLPRVVELVAAASFGAFVMSVFFLRMIQCAPLPPAPPSAPAPVVPRHASDR
ncbi:MAG: serine/threonine-protein kinase [Planctomycetota bacterium]